MICFVFFPADENWSFCFAPPTARKETADRRHRYKAVNSTGFWLYKTGASLLKSTQFSDWEIETATCEMFGVVTIEPMECSGSESDIDSVPVDDSEPSSDSDSSEFDETWSAGSNDEEEEEEEEGSDDETSVIHALLQRAQDLGREQHKLAREQHLLARQQHELLRKWFEERRKLMKEEMEAVRKEMVAGQEAKRKGERSDEAGSSSPESDGW